MREHFVLSDRIEHHFLELSEVPEIKSLEDLKDLSSLGKLALYFRYANDERTGDCVNQLIESGEEAIVMTEHVFRKLTEDDIAYEMQERREKFEHDQATWRKVIMDEGEALGKEEIAKAMKERGYDLEEISQLTGLAVGALQNYKILQSEKELSGHNTAC